MRCIYTVLLVEVGLVRNHDNRNEYQVLGADKAVARPWLKHIPKTAAYPYSSYEHTYSARMAEPTASTTGTRIDADTTTCSTAVLQL